ncbi:MAG: efflux RND transporter periplasmic adaptor subunit [Synergistaceae bacterium]|nr:efflux RND transporter periplasmic adaptor subunit [Synergistaceae bacterium]
MKHIIKFLVGAALVAGILYGFNTLRTKQESQPEPEIIRPVRTITLQDSGASFNRHYFGTVQGGKRADLSFRVAGTLNDIKVEKGAHVKKGALLATLDPRDFNTRLSQAQSALSQAQAQYKDAQANFKRYENLYKQKVVPRATYDTYKTQLDVARSAVRTAEANVKAARDSLNDTRLTAPFEGVIADRTAENFQDINAKQTIFSLQDLSTLEIVFNIPDNDILLAPIRKVNNLQELQANANLFTIHARFDALPDKVFPLKIKEVATQTTGANTYPVTAVMPSQQDFRILPGMAVTVEADFTGDTSENNKFFVPTSAILNQDGNNFVWRYEEGRIRKILVTLGTIRNDSFIEIEGNIKGGNIIVTAGVNFLHEGQHVRLLTED